MATHTSILTWKDEGAWWATKNDPWGHKESDRTEQGTHTVMRTVSKFTPVLTVEYIFYDMRFSH